MHDDSQEPGPSGGLVTLSEYYLSALRACDWNLPWPTSRTPFRGCSVPVVYITGSDLGRQDGIKEGGQVLG